MHVPNAPEQTLLRTGGLGLERMTYKEIPAWDRGKCSEIKEKRDTVFFITQPVRMLHSHPFTVNLMVHRGIFNLCFG